jgi:hypothetical protein
VVQRVEVDRAWLPAARARLVWLVEMLRASDRAAVGARFATGGAAAGAVTPAGAGADCDGGEDEGDYSERFGWEAAKRSGYESCSNTARSAMSRTSRN